MKITVLVLSYDALANTFRVFLDAPDMPCGGGEQVVDSVVLAMMLRQWGEPAEFLAKPSFTIEF